MDPKSNDATAAAAKLPFQEQNNNGVPRLCDRFDFFHMIAFLFITYNAILSIYRSRSRGTPWDLAFVISCYSELMLILYLRRHKNLGTDAPAEQKYQLKFVVWVLTTLLIVTFPFKVSEIMPLSLKIVVWGMSGSMIIAGFYAVFVFNNYVKVAIGEQENKL
ncbi:hypothetical protein LUZ63_016856 [Rhynchospora breviuscula]|uniref:Uncharacterized protein n=1 Tax=Rhynchospora breviuscula TaxID=2022672 RepID=A0A9P9ZCD4_9POAL|nr:hypothetical protein LUZ63_016856 [Rhynchospora breviuscula]